MLMKWKLQHIHICQGTTKLDSYFENSICIQVKFLLHQYSYANTCFIYRSVAANEWSTPIRVNEPPTESKISCSRRVPSTPLPFPFLLIFPGNFRCHSLVWSYKYLNHALSSHELINQTAEFLFLSQVRISHLWFHQY